LARVVSEECVVKIEKASKKKFRTQNLLSPILSQGAAKYNFGSVESAPDATFGREQLFCSTAT
jgi:hypothetical protein